MKTVLLFSGGLDSTVLLYALLREHHDLTCVGFDYGQRHLRELNAANEIALKSKVPFTILKLPGLTGDLIGNFRDPIERPLLGANTVVPGRNLLMLTIAAAFALARGCEAIAIAAHRGDAEFYPDCRTEFLYALESVFFTGYGGPKILRPFIDMSKNNIRLLGQELHVPFHKTWSCYRGMTQPCGECGACLERAKVLGTHENQGMTFAKLRKVSAA
jgi:7-cyano-7-deazaguanine synthase